jgi:energy-coupling factor transport system permease protein
VRSALAYTPGRSPLHRAAPGAAIAYLGALAVVGFVYSSPLVLIAAIGATALAGFSAGAGRAVRASLRLAIPLLIFMVLVNAVVTHRGETILVRGWDLPVLGNTDVTLESLAAGATIGLRVVAVVLAFAVYSACVDPDRVLRALRPIARRSAMTAGLVTRMVPLAAADGARMREAVALRGPGAEPVGRAAMARRLVEGSLDRAVDVAATLELRGHSLPARPQRRRERSRDDLPLYATGAAILALGVAARVAGAGAFDTYPRIVIGSGVLTLALCAALTVLAGIPFAVRRWRSRG